LDFILESKKKKNQRNKRKEKFSLGGLFKRI